MLILVLVLVLACPSHLISPKLNSLSLLYFVCVCVVCVQDDDGWQIIDVRKALSVSQ